MERIIKGFFMILMVFLLASIIVGLISLIDAYPWVVLIPVGLFFCWAIGGLDEE